MPSDRFKNLPAYTDRSIMRKVCGIEQTFYPISADLLFALRGLAPALSAAFASFMDGGAGRDQRVVERTWGTKDAEEFGSHREVEPVSPQIAEARVASREKAIRSLIDVLLGDESKALIGQIICDSVRPRSDEVLPSSEEGIAFFRRQSVDSLREYVGAVIDANQGVFGPLVERVSKMKSALMGRIEEALSASGQHGSQKSLDGGSAATSAAAEASSNREPQAAASI